METWANQHPKVMTWLSKLQRKKNSAWHLYRFCESVGKTPAELLTLKDDPANRDAETLLDNFIATSKFGNANTYNMTVAVKSFYKHSYRDLARASGSGITAIKVKPYRIHSKEELLKIHRSTQNPRDRALITFTWSTGIAKESLIKMQWRHIDADWEQQELPHIGLPDVLIKGHGRGRYKGVEQHTFLTPEAKKDLKDYKDWVERKGIKLGIDDPVFIDTRHGKKVKSLGYNALGQIAMILSQRSGVPFGWHDARRYLETALEQCKINPNWARKIRGRKVKAEEAPYSRPAIEQLRAVYREAVPLLEFTQPTQLMEIQKRQEVVEQITSKMISGEPLTEEDKGNITRYKLRLYYKRAPKRTEHNGGQDCPDGEHCGEEFEQINETQLLDYLRQGWVIVHKLGNGDVVIKNG